MQRNKKKSTYAAVFTFREGEECGNGSNEWRPKAEPRWKIRLDRQILTLRREADIIKAWLDGKIRRERASNHLTKVFNKYGVDGSKKAVEACYFHFD